MSETAPPLEDRRVARQRTITIFLAILLGSLALRVGYLVAARGTDAGAYQALAGDEGEYDALARRLLAGDGFIQTGLRQGFRFLPARAEGKPTAFRTPGMPATVAIVYAVTGSRIGAARFVLAFLNSLIAPLLYLLGLALCRRSLPAILMGVAWAVFPTSIKLAGNLMAEEPATLLVVITGLLALRAQRRSSMPLAAAAGLTLGLAILVRAFLLFVPVALAGWLLVRRNPRLALVLAGAAAVAPGAWIARNAVRVGLPVLSSQGPENVWLGNNRWARGSWAANTWAEQKAQLLASAPDFDQLDEVQIYRFYSPIAKREVLGNPGRVLWLLPRKVALFFSPKSWLGTDPIFGLMVALCFYGAFVLSRDRASWAVLGLAASTIASVLLVSLITFAEVRFRHPIDPFIVVLAGFGLESAISLLRGRGFRLPPTAP